MTNRFWNIEMFMDKLCIIFVAIQSIKCASEKVSFKNSKTSQSKSVTDHDASLAIDKKRETCAIAEQDPETKEPPWWRVQTETLYNIENMIIYFTTNHSDTEHNVTNDLLVFVSADVQQPDKQLCYSFETSKDYVRFKCKRTIYGHLVTIKSAPESNENLILCEVEINLDMSAVNIALRRPIKFNFIDAANMAASVLDGDNGTCVSLASSNEYSTIYIYLDYSYYVTNINMYFQKDAIFKGYKNLTAYVSNHTYFFESHMCGFSKYSYIRIEKDGFLGMGCYVFGKNILIVSNGSNSSLCEIEIFSEEESLVFQGGSLLQMSLLNLKTSQNQLNSTHKSHLAIDGNTDTCSITESNSKNHPWWRVELDRVHFVGELSLYLTSRTSYSPFMNNFYIYLSSNSENYEERLCSSGGSLKNISGKFITFKCKNVTAGRFVTIQRVGGIKQNTLILCEVRLGADRKTVNLALGKPTSQNAKLLKMNSTYAVDNSLTTCAVIVARLKDFAWWRVVLDDSYYITDVNVFFSRNNTDYKDYKIKVFISNDNNNFEDRTCGSSSYSDAEGENSFNITCKVPILGNYVTIKKQGKKKQNWLILCEVEVFSKEDRREMNKKKSNECLSHEYKCTEGGCIHNEWFCDGTDDCPYGDDEPPLCHTKCEDEKFKCVKRNLCLSKESRCDGDYDCPDYSDERACFVPTNGFLTATYKGVSNFYICSKHWHTMFSFAICKDHNSLHLETQFLPVEHATPNVMSIEFPYLSNYVSFAYFNKSAGCDTNKFVKIQCGKQKTTEVCGTRGDTLPSEDFGRYIIGGDNAKAAAWPWHVQIFSNGHYICGGSIIDQMWILTSADCFRNKSLETNIYVNVGTVVLNDRNEQKHSISFVTTHPEYKRDTNYRVNDIALARLKLPLPITNFVRPICLPGKELQFEDLMTYRHCVVSGFGQYDRDLKPKAKYLQQGRMNIMSYIDCAHELTRQVGRESFYSYLDMLINNNFLCAGSLPTKNGINICKGDGGSALVCKDDNNIWTQVGIAKSISFNLGNDLICSINLFTKVDSYLSFIKYAREARD